MQYFSQDGRVLTEDEALGPGGIMRDGVICRTRLTMRDGVPHRPGFASTGTTFNDWVGRDAKRDHDTSEPKIHVQECTVVNGHRTRVM